jgi:cation:H+ antiporter
MAWLSLPPALVFVLSVGVLRVGAEPFVTNAARLARRLGLSELVVGLTVVAMGTSAPEVAVSVDAALVGNGDIAVANVVGSDVFGALLVLGAASVLAPLEVAAAAIGTTTWLLGLSALTALFLWTRGRPGRPEGVALVAIDLTRWALDLL